MKAKIKRGDKVYILTGPLPYTPGETIIHHVDWPRPRCLWKWLFRFVLNHLIDTGSYTISVTTTS